MNPSKLPSAHKEVKGSILWYTRLFLAMTERKERKEEGGELGYPAICHRNVEPSYISEEQLRPTIQREEEGTDGRGKKDSARRQRGCREHFCTAIHASLSAFRSS